MDIKVLFSDLDGTLVEHAGDITKPSIDAVTKLIGHGTDLVLVSGRHPDLMKSIHHKLELETPVIGCNGGIIKNLKTNEVSFINEMTSEKVRNVIEVARKNNIDWVVYEKSNLFFEKMPPKSYQLPYRNSSLPENLRANFVHLGNYEDMFIEERMFIKVLLLFDRNLGAMDTTRECIEKFDGIEIVRSAKSYLDVMSVGTSKGNAIKRYLELNNIERHRTAAIGDAQNDLDMIEFAELGIAMGNAIDSVKDAAQYITTEFPVGFSDAVEYILHN